MAKREPLQIDFSYQNAISYSQYSMFSECQHRWYLSYVKKEKVFKPGIALVFGTAFHEVLQKYLTVMYENTIKEADALDLPSMLKECIISEYKIAMEDNGGVHFSNKEELLEHYEDGVAILEWFKKHRGRFFTTKNTELIGVEVPVLVPISEETPNIFLNGFIDLVMYNKNTDTYTIYDIKTSTRGWGDKEKKNQIKINQVLFYKEYFSRKMGVPQEKIEVMFFICRRKVFENAEFPMHRIQEFIPAQGKTKIKNAVESLKSFVSHSFTENAKYNKEAIYTKNTLSCKYCEYKNRPDLCNKI